MPRKTQQNKITTPELLAQINPENKTLVDDYLSYLKAIQRSDTTIAAYKNDLDIWMCWNVQHNNNKHFCDLSRRNVIAFQDWLLNTNKNSSARVRRLKSSLSALGNYIESMLDDEYPKYRNMIHKVPSPTNEHVREKTVFSLEQLTELMQELVERGQAQKACAVALAMYSGARKSELVRFKHEYFVDSNILYGALYKTPEKIKTKGRGVNGKLLYKYVLSTEFKPYFDNWMKQRDELGINSDWLFVAKSQDGSYAQLDSDTLNSWANSFTQMLGIDFYWHSLRHFFTTFLSTKMNIPDNVIKDIVGWSDVKLVDLYRDTSEDEEMGKYFAEDGPRPEVGFFNK